MWSVDGASLEGERTKEASTNKMRASDAQLRAAEESLMQKALPMPVVVAPKDTLGGLFGGVVTTLRDDCEFSCDCEYPPLRSVHGRNQYGDCGSNTCDDLNSTLKRHACIHKRRSEKDLPAPRSYENPCRRKKIDSYYPRFMMVVLEALRDLKECNPRCDGFTVPTIVEYVWDNFVTDGDIESQVLTALRLAHVSGLVVYMEADNAYRLITPEITNMCASYKRYQRYLRRRRELARPDAVQPKQRMRSQSRSKGSDDEPPMRTSEERGATGKVVPIRLSHY